MRVFVYVAYDGSKFGGFQSQAHDSNTVLETFTKALLRLKITAKPVGSGRTDVGVHATNQVLHVDIPLFWKDLNALKNELNRHLHPNLHVKRICEVTSELHARFSAKKRVYRYLINTKSFDVFSSKLTHHYTKHLDIKKINDGLKLFEGVHDFSMFKKEGSPTSHHIREIYRCYSYFYRGIFVIHVSGSGFLRSQVRLLVGAILALNENKITLTQLQMQIDNKTQTIKKPAPPTGLYLSKIYY